MLSVPGLRGVYPAAEAVGGRSLRNREGATIVAPFSLPAPA